MFRGRNKTNDKAGGKDGKGKGKSKSASSDPKLASIVKIQCFGRRYLSKVRMKLKAEKVYVRVFDPAYKRYFWFNQNTGNSIWERPKVLPLYSPAELKAVSKIQKVIRGFIHRCRAKKLVVQKYSRYFDLETARYYWIDHSTNKTYWVVSKWLLRQNIPLPREDQQLLESHLKIKELERKLQEKDKQIKEIRKQRFEELEPEIIREKVKNARSLKRSKHMEDWSTDDLAAWLVELKMDEYTSILYSNRVDGLLFVQLNESEWRDMGITSKFHLRKLTLVMKGYKTKFERKRAMKDEYDDADDDLVSEYAPSELSDLLAAEDNDVENDSDHESSGVSD